MKVLLVKPFNRSDHIQPSLGLGYLASTVRARHDVRILDCIKENVDLEKLPAIVQEYRPDVVGFQCYTFDVPFIHKALPIIKGIDRKIVTVLGGPHASALPAEMLEREGANLDFVFVGEAETGFPMLLEELEKGTGSFSRIPGLAWRQSGHVRVNPKSVTEDLDALGMPAWDLIHPEEYPEAQHGAFFKQFPIAPIMVTRGCPFPCTFCAGSLVSGKKIRRRSVANVLAELKRLKSEFGIREFHVIDDNFTMDKAYTKEFLKALKALDLGMTWAVPNGVRMDTLDEEMLTLMKETGLYMISLGIESGSDKVLGMMKKGITTAKMREAIAMIDRSGIDMAGFFILGFPGETEETMRQTIDFAAELPLKRANFFTYLPFPGTESYTALCAAGELDGVDWERFYFTNAAYVPRGLTRKRLKEIHRQAFARFYLRPHILFYQLRSIQSPRHFSFLAQRFLRWIVAS